MSQLFHMLADGAGIVQGGPFTLPAGTTIDGAGGGSTLSVAAWDDEVTYVDDQLCTYEGSLYVSLQNGNLNHQPDESVTWWLCIVSAGTDGSDGSDGDDGADGGDFHCHDYAPSVGDGNTGDLWVNTLSGDLYYKIDGAWVWQCRLQIGHDILTTPDQAVTQYKVYWNNAGTWTTADPDTADCELAELVIAQGDDVGDDGMLVRGPITNTGWSWAGTSGAPLWIDDDGELTETKPTSSTHAGRVARVCAWIRSATSIMFDGHVPGDTFQSGS